MAKLMDEIRDALRVKGYALKTEKQYLNWIRRYVRHYLPRHPRETGEAGVREFTTHLYQSGVDIRTIQELLGHQKLETTMIYVHLLGGAAVRSPLDRVSVSPVIRRTLVES